MYAFGLFSRQPNADLSAEEVEKCKVQTHQLFDNVFERMFLLRFTVRKADAHTYYVQTYLLLGIPYDGAVLSVLEPYRAKHAGQEDFRNRWNCEGSMTRIGFRQAAP